MASSSAPRRQPWQGPRQQRPPEDAVRTSRVTPSPGPKWTNEKRPHKPRVNHAIVALLQPHSRRLRGRGYAPSVARRLAPSRLEGRTPGAFGSATGNALAVGNGRSPSESGRGDGRGAGVGWAWGLRGEGHHHPGRRLDPPPLLATCRRPQRPSAGPDSCPWGSANGGAGGMRRGGGQGDTESRGGRSGV